MILSLEHFISYAFVLHNLGKKQELSSNNKEYHLLKYIIYFEFY
jgi:hypothetical protein